MLFEKIFKFCQHDITISLLFSSGKGRGQLSEQTRILFTQPQMFCAKLNLAMQLRLENKMKKGKKNYRQTTEYRRSEKLHWAFS